MTFNPIEIYQRSKKTQHVKLPDPSRPDFFRKIKLNRPEPEPNPTRPIATSIGSSQVSSRSGFGSTLVFRSFGRVRFWIVWSRVISGFQVVRVRIGSGFGLSNLESSRISGRSGSDRVRFGSVDFLKKIDRIEFGSRWVKQISRNRVLLL
jgi:hypothetical protein